ncbi:MAG: hypothetical protein RLZZ15_292 [Verrucomicrobiota bacterium]|jgi:hypothetical protein
MLAKLDGTGSVSFREKLGAPASLQLPRLIPLNTHADAAVKFFSGAATYTKTITAPPAWFRDAPGARLQPDLGRVDDPAEITLNGHALGQLWKPPYLLDVSSALRPGENKLESSVTNRWTIRITGDRVAPADQKILNLPPAAAAAGRPRTARLRPHQSRDAFDPQPTVAPEKHPWRDLMVGQSTREPIASFGKKT